MIARSKDHEQGGSRIPMYCILESQVTRNAREDHHGEFLTSFLDHLHSLPHVPPTGQVQRSVKGQQEADECREHRNEGPNRALFAYELAKVLPTDCCKAYHHGPIQNCIHACLFPQRPILENSSLKNS